MGYPVLSVTAEKVGAKLTKLRSFRSPWLEEKTIFKQGGGGGEGRPHLQQELTI